MSSTSNGPSRRRRGAEPGGGPAHLARRQAEAVNRRDLEGLLALYAEDAVLEFPASPAIAGKSAIRRAFERFFQDWEEEITLHHLVASGRVVAAEGTAQGRHRTLHMKIPGRSAIPPRPYRHAFAAFWEIHRGKIRRHRVYYDARDLVRQVLGA